MQEHDAKQAKDNMKVMAKIAYKEWKERKCEEGRHKRKVERMEKRRQEMEEEQIRMERRQLVREMQKRQGNSGQILLAYGLNKNIKQLEEGHHGVQGTQKRMARAQSAKGRRDPL